MEQKFFVFSVKDESSHAVFHKADVRAWDTGVRLRTKKKTGESLRRSVSFAL
jgi:hypothetical protein